jgi:hypothetical protein
MIAPLTELIDWSAIQVLTWLRPILLLLLAVNAGWARPIELSPRLITLPANADAPFFADRDGDGRSDLFAIDPVEKKLLSYHQRPDGFPHIPDQSIPLPPQTAWVALGDVDKQPGLELLISTATGLVYSRQNAGRFESERHTLIEAGQVFTNCDFPVLTSLTTNKAGTNDLIPLISAGQAVPYHRNDAYEWSSGPPLRFDSEQTTWSVNLYPLLNPWTLGRNPAHRLRVQQSFRTKPDPKQDKEPENEIIRKIIADMKTSAKAGPPMTDHLDVDGDGREDLVLWQVCGTLSFRTDIYIFLRGADQQLPGQPTQILHCSGIPIPIGPQYDWSPVHDLHGDGICELVLLEFKPSLTSASGFLEMVLSHGIDWSLTIRSSRRSGYSSSPDASIPMTAILPAEILSGWPFFIQGDFNGDGRPDFLVRRSDTQWFIFTSTTDGRWFAPQPTITFETPPRGYIEINDLNGDGLSDIIWHEPDEHRLSIFMSPPRPAKDKNP